MAKKRKNQMKRTFHNKIDITIDYDNGVTTSDLMDALCFELAAAIFVATMHELGIQNIKDITPQLRARLAMMLATGTVTSMEGIRMHVQSLMEQNK